MIINVLKRVLNSDKEVDIHDTWNESDKLFLVLAKEESIASNQSPTPVPTFHVIAQYGTVLMVNHLEILSQCHPYSQKIILAKDLQTPHLSLDIVK